MRLGASLNKLWKCHGIPIETKLRLQNALVWPVATFGCESWTVRKEEETRINAFEMKGLRKILRVSWAAKKTNEWVLENATGYCQIKETIVLGTCDAETRKQPGKGDHARNNARISCQRKTTHDLDGQCQDMDRTHTGGVNQEDRG